MFGVGCRARGRRRFPSACERLGRMSIERRKRATIIDVAHAAGVSKSTVSRVLSGKGHYAEETRRRIEEAVRDVGYTVNPAARSLRADNTHLIGLLVRNAHNPVYGRMHRELQQAAYERELQLLSMTVVSPEATRRELQAVRDLVGLRVGALIVASGTIPSDDLAEIVGEVPTLVLGRPEAHPRLHNVSFDEYRHGMMLADQVVSVGYRRAVVLTLDAKYSQGAHVRTAATVDQLRRHGIEVVDWPVDRNMLSEAELDEILALPGPQVLMCPFDRVALDVMRKLRARGLTVPETLGLTGCDGLGDGIDLIGLTTVRLPVEEVAQRGIELVAEMLEQVPTRPVRELVCGELMVGETLQSFR